MQKRSFFTSRQKSQVFGCFRNFLMNFGIFAGQTKNRKQTAKSRRTEEFRRLKENLEKI